MPSPRYRANEPMEGIIRVDTAPTLPRATRRTLLAVTDNTPPLTSVSLPGTGRRLRHAQYSSGDPRQSSHTFRKGGREDTESYVFASLARLRPGIVIAMVHPDLRVCGDAGEGTRRDGGRHLPPARLRPRGNCLALPNRRDQTRVRTFSRGGGREYVGKFAYCRVRGGARRDYRLSHRGRPGDLHPPTADEGIAQLDAATGRQRHENALTRARRAKDTGHIGTRHHASWGAAGGLCGRLWQHDQQADEETEDGNTAKAHAVTLSGGRAGAVLRHPARSGGPVLAYPPNGGYVARCFSRPCSTRLRPCDAARHAAGLPDEYKERHES